MVANRRDSVGRMRLHDIKEALHGMGQDTNGRAEHLRDRLRAARAAAAADKSTEAVPEGSREQHEESKMAGQDRRGTSDQTSTSRSVSGPAERDEQEEEHFTRVDDDDGVRRSSPIEKEATASSADPADIASSSNNNSDTAQLSQSTIAAWLQTHPVLTSVTVIVFVLCIISFVYWFRSGSDMPPLPRPTGSRPNDASPVTTSVTVPAAGPMVASYSNGTVTLVNAWQQNEELGGL